MFLYSLSILLLALVWGVLWTPYSLAEKSVAPDREFIDEWGSKCLMKDPVENAVVSERDGDPYRTAVLYKYCFETEKSVELGDRKARPTGFNLYNENASALGRRAIYFYLLALNSGENNGETSPFMTAQELKWMYQKIRAVETGNMAWYYNEAVSLISQEKDYRGAFLALRDAIQKAPRDANLTVMNKIIKLAKHCYPGFCAQAHDPIELNSALDTFKNNQYVWNIWQSSK